MAQATHDKAIDPLTGCLRTDIQCEWRAEIIATDGRVRRSTTFYLHPDCNEASARARAIDIWMPARSWPADLRLTLVRAPLAEWPSDDALQVAA